METLFFNQYNLSLKKKKWSYFRLNLVTKLAHTKIKMPTPFSYFAVKIMFGPQLHTEKLKFYYSLKRGLSTAHCRRSPKIKTKKYIHIGQFRNSISK